jgi:hypothetical protein
VPLHACCCRVTLVYNVPLCSSVSSSPPLPPVNSVTTSGQTAPHTHCRLLASIARSLLDRDGIPASHYCTTSAQWSLAALCPLLKTNHFPSSSVRTTRTLKSGWPPWRSRPALTHSLTTATTTTPHCPLSSSLPMAVRGSY